jgi:osmoprotectant transport system permease protein
MTVLAPMPPVIPAEGKSEEEIARLRERIPLIITPVMFLFLLAVLGAVYVYADFDRTTADILRPSRLVNQFQAHIWVTMWSTVLVVTIAVPLGILLTRDAYRRFAPSVVGFANSGQAIPAYGLIIIFFTWMGRGPRTAIIALTVFAILPVLRNTMVGLDQVDRATIEAARGMGMSKRGVLRRIELPLAVPVILAGVRTALVINVGMAALVFLIGAGGLGETINSGLKLQRNTAIFVGASMVALLALAIDFLGALAERYLRPKGV